MENSRTIRQISHLLTCSSVIGFIVLVVTINLFALVQCETSDQVDADLKGAAARADNDDAFPLLGPDEIMRPLIMDFKFEVSGGQKECFWQHMRVGSRISIAYEVMRGGDRKIDMFITTPDGSIFDEHLWTTDGFTDKFIHNEGEYRICLDNTMGRYGSKLVYFYLMVFEVVQWEQYVSEMGDVVASTENFTQSLKSVETSLTTTISFQTYSRMLAVRDWYTVLGNQKFVQAWSIGQCLVIMLTGAVQVYFVRRLFVVSKVTPTLKPRA